MRKLIAGNWKMNGFTGSIAEFDAMIAGIGAGSDMAEALICPPFTLVSALATRAGGTAMAVGAQDCHTESAGAHTGDVSAEMLADAGAGYVIVGHSERRADHGESNEQVAAKAEAAFRAGLTPIICLGESLETREAGATEAFVLGQLAASVPETAGVREFVIAYEPIWAIGTGLTADAGQIGEVHSAIRKALIARFDEHGAGVRILYGGSMKPGNAAEILGIENVDGGLIGGASLKAADFLAIYAAAV